MSCGFPLFFFNFIFINLVLALNTVMLSYSHGGRFLMYTGSTMFSWSFYTFRDENNAFLFHVIIVEIMERSKVFNSCSQRQRLKKLPPEFFTTTNNKTNLFHFCFNSWPVNPLLGNKWKTGADVKIKKSIWEKIHTAVLIKRGSKIRGVFQDRP